MHFIICFGIYLLIVATVAFPKPAEIDSVSLSLSTTQAPNTSTVLVDVEYDDKSESVIVNVDQDDSEDNSDVSIINSDINPDSDTVYLSEEEEDALVNGVLRDFQFNETVPESELNKLISSPGCPRSIEDIVSTSSVPWVYYGKEQKCFLTGIRGPCPTGMKLSSIPGSQWGVCKCDCYFSNINEETDATSQNHTKPFCFDPDNEMHYVYFPDKQKCYPLLFQGPCKDNEWLVLDEPTDLPKCEVRKCPASNLENPRYFYDKESKSCKMFGSFCEKRINSSVSLQYSVDNLNWLPECKTVERSGREIYRSVVVGISPIDCKSKGYVYSKRLETCVRRFSKGQGGVIG